MCRVYSKDGEPHYLRACAKTGQRGRRVPWREAAPFVDDYFDERGGCISLHAYERFLKSSGVSPDGRTLRFKLTPLDALNFKDCLHEILRWQTPDTVARLDETSRVLTLEREEPWLDIQEILKRAKTFDWRPVAEYER